MSADMFRMAWFAGTSTTPPAWNKPWSSTNGRTWARPDFHIDLARALERGGFDYVMFEDGSFISDSYGGNPDTALRNAWAAPKSDPMPYVPLIARATRHIGIVATAATTFYPPFTAARLGATLDHLTEGRFGFNLVTAHNDRSAQNYGHPHVPEHATRYEMASEWVDVVGALWNSWEPGAIVDDREGGSFVDPSKVHTIDHEGRFFNCHGPLNTAPGPQRRPVLCQAGGSGSGMAFAAKHVDTIIAVIANVEEASTYRRRMDGLLAAVGRSPKDVNIFFSVSLVISDSDEEALERRRRLDEAAMADIEKRLFKMSYVTGIDFSRFALDERLPPIATNASKSMADKITRHADLTLREIASRPHGSGISFTGTPETIAAQMDEAMQEIGGDGFLVNELPARRIIAEIADGLCPALQQRGLIRRHYPYTTFRENLASF